jgi:hypothetical protein
MASNAGVARSIRAGRTPRELASLRPSVPAPLNEAGQWGQQEQSAASLCAGIVALYSVKTVVLKCF